jgi:hypothetical protein
MARVRNFEEEEALRGVFDENLDFKKFDMTAGYSCFFCTLDDKVWKARIQAPSLDFASIV